MKAKVRLQNPQQKLQIGSRTLSGSGNFVLEWEREAIKAHNNGQIVIVKKYDSDEEADKDSEPTETLPPEPTVLEAPAVGPVVSTTTEEPPASSGTKKK